MISDYAHALARKSTRNLLDLASISVPIKPPSSFHGVLAWQTLNIYASYQLNERMSMNASIEKYSASAAN